MKPTTLKVGDEVGYAASFLRSTGQYTGNAPFRRGKVVAIDEAQPNFALVTVEWKDGRTSNALASNLAKIGSIAWAGV